jgi:DNA relaxase NicK
MSAQKNGGVLVTPPLKLSEHLDWIELTYPILAKAIPQMYPEHWQTNAVQCKPLFGYNNAVRYEDGRLEMWHSEQKSMGFHVSIPAQAIQALHEDDLWLLEYFITNGAKITRLDCAVDVLDYPLPFDELWKLAQNDEFECRLRKDPQRTHETKRGDTIYFGRMKSSVFTRFYDKAAEQKQSGDWTRIETVFRHSRANNAAKLMVKRKLTTRQMIAGHVNLPRLQWWRDVMACEAVKTRVDPSMHDKRLDWLMNSVPSALAKEIKLRGETVRDLFNQRVAEALQKLDNTQT